MGDLKGYTLLDLDFMYHAMVTDLNSVPLDPQISNMSPKDFLLGYKALPIKISFHDKPKNSAIMQKIYDSYKRMNDTYKASKSLSPYLWCTKQSGSIKKMSKSIMSFISRAWINLGLCKN